MISLLVLHYARPTDVNAKNLADFVTQNIVIVVYVKIKNNKILHFNYNGLK